MHRRDYLRWTAMGLGVLGTQCLPQSAPRAAQQAAAAAPLEITDIQTILTAPAKIRLVIVKGFTSDAGLYGLGCATFTQRARVVETAINQYLRPFLIGKNPLQIEDT